MSDMKRREFITLLSAAFSTASRLSPATDLSLKDHLVALVYRTPIALGSILACRLQLACLFADAPLQPRPRPLRTWPDKRGRVGRPRLRCDRTMLCWRPC